MCGMFYRYLQDTETNVVYAEYNIYTLNITRGVHSVSNMFELSPCFTCDGKLNQNNTNITIIVCTRWNINETILDNRNLFSFRIKKNNCYPGCAGILLQGGDQFHFKSDKAESCNARCDQQIISDKTNCLNSFLITTPASNTTNITFQWSTLVIDTINSSKTIDTPTKYPTHSLHEDSTANEKNILPLVIGIVCSVLFIALVIFGTVLYRRKKMCNCRKSECIPNKTNHEQSMPDLCTTEIDEKYCNDLKKYPTKKSGEHNVENCESNPIQSVNVYTNDGSKMDFSHLTYNNIEDSVRSQVTEGKTKLINTKPVDLSEYNSLYETDYKNIREQSTYLEIYHDKYAVVKEHVHKVYANV